MLLSPTILKTITASLLLATAAACGPDLPPPPPTPLPTATVAPATVTATPIPNVPTPRAGTPTPDFPVGFPLASTLRPMRVVEEGQKRSVVAPLSNGPTIQDVAKDIQSRPQNDMESNRYGWNCRIHDKYEGTGPAVDWYLPENTDVTASMGGIAELYVITTANTFEYYGVDNTIMLGLPPATTALYPIPGPSGGMGVFVSILNGKYRAEYGHLNLASTLTIVPKDAYDAPYSPTYNYNRDFGRPRDYREYQLIARWHVRKGDIVGKVGNTGYSDVAHLHYQIVTADRKTKYCPTEEQFTGAGWLFKRPTDLP